MGRPSTGSIVWADPDTKTTPIGVRVTTGEGRRKVVPLDPGTTADDARALAPLLAERARHAVDERVSETVAEYAKRWCDWRESRGLSTVGTDRTLLHFHVVPMIGSLPIAADIVTADQGDENFLLDARPGCIVQQKLDPAPVAGRKAAQATDPEPDPLGR